MQDIFYGISKYLFVILMSFFVFFSYIIMRDKNNASHRAAFSVQSAMMYVLHFIGFLIILMKTQNKTIVLFYGAQLIMLILLRGLYGLIFDDLHSKGLMNNMCMLLCISFIVLTRLQYRMAVKQFIIVCVAAAGAVVTTLIVSKAGSLHRLTYFYCFAGIALLAVVLILGQTTKGANLSVSIAGFYFQPSEFVKILYVFFLAAFLSKNVGLKKIAVSAVFAGLHVLILVFSRDLGSALIFFMVYVAMVFVATGKMRYFLAGMAGGAAASVIGYRLFPHIRVRVQAFRDPWTVIDDQGYQVTQSLFAIGTGGFLGLGLYNGSPKSVPLVAQDFIFAAISEELGGFFALCLILLCISCFLFFIKSAIQIKSLFHKLIGAGLAVAYAVQTILTIGGAVKFIPSTGVTLPLVSYGGSSVLCTMIVFAVLQGIFVIGRREEEERQEQEAQSADPAIMTGFELPKMNEEQNHSKKNRIKKGKQ